MAVVKANIHDSDTLTDITKKSKAYWGYTDSQIIAWNDQLTITAAYIKANEVYKLLIEGMPAGYYSYFFQNDGVARLDNLFVLPQCIGKGCGTLLMDDFIFRVKSEGGKKIVLEADPNAEGFYFKFGFKTTSLVKTSTKGRYLPVMELYIA
jgi:GNAT superfamily N-acetyltransferase